MNLPVHDCIKEDGQGKGKDAVGDELRVVVPTDV